MGMTLRRHLPGVLFLAPFYWMMWQHYRLGLTDAFLMGDQRSANYNVVMMGVWLLGVIAFLTHTLYLYSREYHKRWLVARLLVLAGTFAAVYLYWFWVAAAGRGIR